MQTHHDQKSWTTQSRSQKNERDVNSNARSVGSISSSSETVGNITVGISGTFSEGSTIITLRLTGGILSQLIKELRDQLAYHQKQVDNLHLELNQHQKKSEDIRLKLQEYEDLLQEIENYPQQ